MEFILLIIHKAMVKGKTPPTKDFLVTMMKNYTFNQVFTIMAAWGSLTV